ncbi:hypothetical protein OPV22_035068 [Ensete ventricosum]|uniref:MADS-box domain-containing protein n=1 Tax=Ensete ventricosum TaxID=4639 RepID=A0AAV8NZQ0_ENSVE|nr:hypothetical protein OPV22_035068 [Ensete ventricosum]
MESSLVATAKKKGTSQGKQKIAIKKIEDRALRRVVFNKLRKDFFSMAAKLCATTGARIDIIVFSPSGRHFTFGGPSVAAALRAFLLDSLRRPTEPEEVFAGWGRRRRCSGGWRSYGRWLSQEPTSWHVRGKRRKRPPRRRTSTPSLLLRTTSLPEIERREMYLRCWERDVCRSCVLVHWLQFNTVLVRDK